MTILNQDKCVLMVIDVQEKLLNAVYNPNVVRKNSLTLVNAAKILNIPIFITEQYPKGLGKSIEGISSEFCFEKCSFNALMDIDFDFKDKTQIIILGIETHICVYQTVNTLIEKGLDVTIVSDACSSRSEENYALALECMKSMGAQIKSTEMILFELIKSSKHPNFKEIQGLIK